MMVSMKDKICSAKNCSAPFAPKRKSQKYCSNPCSINTLNSKHNNSVMSPVRASDWVLGTAGTTVNLDSSNSFASAWEPVTYNKWKDSTHTTVLPAVKDLPAAYLKECFDYWYSLVYDEEEKGTRIA